MSGAETYYRLVTWSHGGKFFCSGDPVAFVARRQDATLYTEDQARAIQKRFRKSRTSRMRLKLELVEASVLSRCRDKLSEPLNELTRQLLMFD